MAISINPSTYVISIPQADLTPLGGTNYQLDTNAFRIWLKDWEDSEDGIYQPKTHNHNTVVTIGGIQYARLIEILSPYTVTFQDVGSPYKVFLIASNNNILDKTNLNNVSVAPNNSAGLINVVEVQYAAFNGGVAIDVINGSIGVVYPKGTAADPVNNLLDAQTIAVGRGFDTLFVNGSLTIANGENVSNYKIVGKGATINSAETTITLESGCTTSNTRFEHCKVTGVQGGECDFEDCVINTISNTHCMFRRCALLGTTTMVNSGWTVNHTTEVHECYTSMGQADWYILDYNASPIKQFYTNFTGNIKIINFTNANGKIVIGLDAGKVWIDASCTAGTIVIRGVADVINDGSCTVDDHSVCGGIIREMHDEAFGKWVLDPDTDTLTLYKSDGVTILKTFNLTEASGNVPVYVQRVPA